VAALPRAGGFGEPDKELGEQFGIKRLCVQNFWGTEALHHLAITAYNLCVLLQRRLGQLAKYELNTLRWRLLGRAAVWSRAGGKPTLKLAVRGKANRNWWREMLGKLTAPPNGHAVGSLLAGTWKTAPFMPVQLNRSGLGLPRLDSQPRRQRFDHGYSPGRQHWLCLAAIPVHNDPRTKPRAIRVPSALRCSSLVQSCRRDSA
jgi:hypothetical protein